MEHPKALNNLNCSKDVHGNSYGNTMRGVAGLEEKKAAVHTEISRVNRLPSNSSYAVHRMRVLNKLLHLLSIQVILQIICFGILFTTSFLRSTSFLTELFIFSCSCQTFRCVIYTTHLLAIIKLSHIEQFTGIYKFDQNMLQFICGK